MGAFLFSGVRAATAAPSDQPDHKETPMAYPTNRTIKTVDLTAYSPSVGATPVAAYVRIPFRCQIVQASSVLGGAITTADSLAACALNGGAAFATIQIVQPGWAAGQVNTVLPAAATYANENDSVAFTPSGASGANISAAFSLTIRQL